MAVSPRDLTETMKEAMRRFVAAEEPKTVDFDIFVQGTDGFSCAVQYGVTHPNGTTEKFTTLQRAVECAKTDAAAFRAALNNKNPKVGEVTVSKTYPAGFVELVKVGQHYFRFRKEAAAFLQIPVDRLMKRINGKTPVAGYDLEIVSVDEKRVHPAAYKATPPSVAGPPADTSRIANVVPDVSNGPPIKKQRVAPGPTTVGPYIRPWQFCALMYGGKTARIMAEEAAAEKREPTEEELSVAETMMTLVKRVPFS